MNLVLPLLLSLCFLAGAGLSYYAGYDSAKQKYTHQLMGLKKDYAEASLAAAVDYQITLNNALIKSQAASRSFLSAQSKLKLENEKLKEQLDEASANSDCTVDAKWLHHYRSALGVPATNTSKARKSSAGKSDESTANATGLLRHATEYGLWCRTNTEQLIELQTFIRDTPINYE